MIAYEFGLRLSHYHLFRTSVIMAICLESKVFISSGSIAQYFVPFRNTQRGTRFEFGSPPRLGYCDLSSLARRYTQPDNRPFPPTTNRPPPLSTVLFMEQSWAV